ncbi:MAG: flagellar biosynthesis protein FlhB [Spirochaetaceae bacterium]|nr:flagellar biosynthesis protein FlhB [Spirochaetaceae bacterium]
MDFPRLLIKKPEDCFVPSIDLQWFAAEDEGRTEEPTERKIRKAREEGRLAKSQDLNTAVVFLLVIMALVFLAKWILRNCLDLMGFFFTRCTNENIMDGAFGMAFFAYFLKITLPLLLIAMIAGVVANLIQNNGFLVSTKPLEPDFSKIVPNVGKYLQKTIFSVEGGFNIFKSIFKVVVLFAIAYIIIKDDLATLMSMINTNLYQGFTHVAKMAAKLLFTCAGFFLIMAVPDYLVQKYQFRESLKMTKTEVMQEYKEEEGNPMVKGQLKQRMRSMMMQNLPKFVAKADVVITNPTHLACAIEYDRTTMDAPQLNAKGADLMAQRIKEIAAENNVPIIENKPLARAIYATVEVGDQIPEKYFQAIATVLSQVYKMNAEKAKKWL